MHVFHGGFSLLSGIIKCSERICALYYGSASSFRSYNFTENRAKPLIRMNGDALSELQVMQYAFVYFTTFKGLVVDLTLKSHERNQSREFFLATSCKEAFRIVEVELKYFYDALFTKLPVLHHKFGYCSRTLSFIAVVSSLAVFHFGVNNKLFIWTDVVITYILLIGAIVLDMIQFFMPPFDANAKRKSWKLEIEGLDTFLPFVVDNNYDNILLLWHIATEVCYNDPQDQLTSNLEQRNTAKQLSDYMLYLMVMKPDMMFAVCSTGKIKFQDTCIEVSKLFDTKLPELKKKKCCFFGRESGKEEALHTKACETILSINSEVKVVPGHKDEYKLLLFDASVLAKELKLLPSERKWLTLSKLWVELLSYAASHIRSSAHAQQLNEGGELITVVWLLMAHFGLGDQYEISPGMEGKG
ncbi:hypothetical protein POM88_020017 [Heracleum sosnowskyi]|uniref:DUF4220 domain-containing protein n=1 Tax=Heracleum sosnowskyi TaxID=360622 RepID=A0AAD8IAK9_9APIA|nr:hypothetical protein POM88_020017 [Heracleum sosnowskyi]